MKKTVKILSLVAAIVMILSCGVAFADEKEEKENTRGRGNGTVISQEAKEKREQAKEQWVNSLSAEDKAKYDEYLAQKEKIGPLKEELRTIYKENRELHKQIRDKVKAYKEDENLTLTEDQIAMIKDIAGKLKGNLNVTKATSKARVDALKRVNKDLMKNDRPNAEQIKENVTDKVMGGIDRVLENFDDLVARMNEQKAQALETNALLKDLLATFE